MRERKTRTGFSWVLCALLTLLAFPAGAQDEDTADTSEDTSMEESAEPEVKEPEPEATPMAEAEAEAEPEPAAMPEEAPAREDVDEMVVTGSRIKTDVLDKPAPVLTLTREDLLRAGLTSAADILQRLPVSGGALNTKFNSSGNFGFPPDGGGIGAGSAQADLRYLGSKRVLVLVDGIRWVDGSSGSGVPSAIDLNTIPVGVIERVEVLQDGASAVYGSDAIAGVINIITRQDFQGFEADAYMGTYHQGDGVTQQYNLSWGNQADRMKVFFNLSYVGQGQISARDRAISKFPIPGVDECTPNCSSGTPQGRVFVLDAPGGPGPDPNDIDITLNDGATVNPGSYNVGGLNPNYHDFTTADRFNFAPFNFLLTPSERLGFLTQLEYEVTSKTKFRLKALYNHRRSQNQAAPEPIFIGSEAGNGNRLDQISVDVTNPYNPFDFTLDADTMSYFIGRRPIEAGPRLFKQSVNTMYLAGGFDGSFSAGKNTYFWDATAAVGLNRADQIKTGAFNSAKLEMALGPVDLCNADPECVPFNIFGGQDSGGGGTITREMLDYVQFTQKDVSQQELVDLSANISGTIVQLPAGPLSAAVGVEHRRKSGFFQPDAVVLAGDSAGVPSSATAGSYYANEAYAELLVPILEDLPGANLLDLSAAIRYSDYSTFGGQETFKVGARWKPVSDLMFRGNYAQGFRAPGIGELFGSAARFDQTLSDPCSGIVPGTTPQSVIDSCVALGVPGDGSYTQFNSQISVTTGGNPNLQPETSSSITAGVVYGPDWLKRQNWVEEASVEVTYYRLEMENAIQAIDAQVQIDSCIQTQDPALCDGISRTSTGVINGFANQLTNIGKITTDGIDLALNYVSPQMSIGRFRGTSISSFLMQFTETIPTGTGFQDVQREGTEVGDPEQAYPRLKSTFVLDWFHRRMAASWTARYINSVEEPCRGLGDFSGLCSDPDDIDELASKNTINAVVYNDLRFSWNPPVLEDRVNVTLGVNNVFNQAPPNCYSCALNGFDATTYDVPGVFGYLKAGYRL